MLVPNSEQQNLTFSYTIYRAGLFQDYIVLALAEKAPGITHLLEASHTPASPYQVKDALAAA